MSRLLGKCAKDSSLFSSSFHPLWLHAVALCPAFPLLGALQSQVHPFLVSILRSLAVLHCLQLFVPLGLRSYLVDLVPRQLGFYFALSVSFLQPVRHSLSALLV